MAGTENWPDTGCRRVVNSVWQFPLFREKALLDTASEKNGTIEAPIRVLEHSQALTRILFGHFGPQNRHLGPKGTKRAKRRDWLAEDAVASELLSAVNREIYREFYSLSRSNAP
jgi:hypothetical protein